MTVLAPSTLIVLREASVAYGAVQAVRAATMRVSQGDFIAVVGANGSGKTSLLLAWDERYALLTVLIASFGRAISEVGAVMIVGGNIDGFTRVMTTAIALETSKGDLPLALGLGLILLSLSVAISTIALLVVGRIGEK